jgi:hypothetical protein
MFDIGLIRDVVAIAGVFIGLSYYIMNIREVRKNRRISLTTTLLQHFMTREGYENVMEIMSMEWDSVEDFMSKYDHRVDRSYAARRMALWNTCNTLGYLYREGSLDLKTIFSASGGIIINIWNKFKPIIEYYRTADFGENAYEDFEFLAMDLEGLIPENTLSLWKDNVLNVNR